MLESIYNPSFRPAVSPNALAPHALEAMPARRKLLQEGRRCDELFVVHRGWLVAFRQLPDGGRQIFNFWLPGEVCGVEFIAIQTAPFCVATLTACQLSRVPRDAVARRDIETSSALAALACRNSLILRERIVGLGRRTAPVRVAHLLLELTCRSRIGSGCNEPLPLTQLEVADSTGLTATYVNRIFRMMRDRGQIEMSREGLRLLDVPRLMREVRFNPAYLDEARIPAGTFVAA
jgi:CRP-like cAMP-binding protein